MNLSLFDEPPLRSELRDELAALAREFVFIGTSSWKYEGWLDQIYSRERYMVKGRFSKKKFEAECLREYAEVFPVVCGDFSFYQFPAPEFWVKLFTTAPQALRFAFKVPEEITVKLFPVHPRYGPRAGLGNESFLNVEIFKAMFLYLLAPYRERIAALIFEFTPFPRRAYDSTGDFLRELDPFLVALPAEFRYAVEIRNPEFIEPDYFKCLRSHNIAHVFTSWTRMPEMGVQMKIPGAFTSDFTVVRALLRHGRAYEDAVAKFSPYETVQDENPAVRDALRAMILRAKERHEAAYIFVNNRLEGNAPGTIRAVVKE